MGYGLALVTQQNRLGFNNKMYPKLGIGHVIHHYLIGKNDNIFISTRPCSSQHQRDPILLSIEKTRTHNVFINSN